MSNVKFLFLVACYGGHYKYQNSNVASALSQKISGTVFSSDGPISNVTHYSDNHISFVSSSYDFTVDEKTKKRVRIYNDIDYSGWIIYKFDRKKIKVFQ
ncbi:MAG: hypothetical protein K6G26_14075 [Lachnospiraceae bacterium]|nr:hypothetical protein [Lachnospiraceae bacterium]